MFTVYIIQNNLSKKYYVGFTNNFCRRENEHNRGQTKSTKSKGKWNLVYEEEFKTRLEAIKRERQIKSYKGGNAFKKLIAAVVQW